MAAIFTLLANHGFSGSSQFSLMSFFLHRLWVEPVVHSETIFEFRFRNFQDILDVCHKLYDGTEIWISCLRLAFIKGQKISEANYRVLISSKKWTKYFLKVNCFWDFLTFSRLTLDSGIDVGPTFIKFAFFSRPYCLIREGESTFLCNMYRVNH